MAKRTSSSSTTTTKGRTTTPGSPARTGRSAAKGQSGPAKSAGKSEVTHEMIAKRAYEIYASGQGGNAEENWRRAEAELQG